MLQEDLPEDYVTLCLPHTAILKQDFTRRLLRNPIFVVLSLENEPAWISSTSPRAYCTRIILAGSYTLPRRPRAPLQQYTFPQYDRISILEVDDEKANIRPLPPKVSTRSGAGEPSTQGADIAASLTVSICICCDLIGSRKLPPSLPGRVLWGCSGERRTRQLPSRVWKRVLRLGRHVTAG